MLKQQSEQHTKFPSLIPQEKLNIVAITWNLYGSLPPHQSLTELFSSKNLQPLPDVIYVGTQECQRSLSASFCCQAKTEWQGMLVFHLKDYFLAASEAMRGLHIAILVKNNHFNYFELERKTKMRAGVPCNLMGNKGAIAVQFSILGQAFQFINCHLAANQNETQKRNQTIHRVMNDLVRRQENYEVIFLGDLNYRINLEKAQYERMKQGRKNTQAQMSYTEMLGRDQLRNQQILKPTFLSKFQEGIISFPPTYKIGVFTKQYNVDRIPGWTDRIFHRKGSRLKRTKYFCQYDILGSDHRPVVAIYEILLEQHTATQTLDHFVGVKGDKCQLI